MVLLNANPPSLSENICINDDFDPNSLELAGFKLVHGLYQAIAPTQTGYLWSDQLELYLGIHERQLRWFSLDGQLLLLPEEQERLAKEQAQQRVEKLELLLRSQGIDPDQVNIFD